MGKKQIIEYCEMVWEHYEKKEIDAFGLPEVDGEVIKKEKTKPDNLLPQKK
jgi:hypothetical protein